MATVPEEVLPTSLERLAREKIETAIAHGWLDDQPLRGQPLSLMTNPFEPASQRLANHVLRSAGMAPPWIELDRAARRARACCENIVTMAARGRFGSRAECEQRLCLWGDRLADLQERRNLLCPLPVKRSAVVRTDYWLSRLDDVWPPESERQP